MHQSGQAWFTVTLQRVFHLASSDRLGSQCGWLISTAAEPVQAPDGPEMQCTEPAWQLRCACKPAGSTALHVAFKVVLLGALCSMSAGAVLLRSTRHCDLAPRS